MSKCKSIKINKYVECTNTLIGESLANQINRLKHNQYMTKEVWEKKIILDTRTGEWYSYADIDKIING